ncbi:sodium-coupled neutral amino acid transporter 7-like [Physella acuta]|uniref:sodium-coupled neutral amino acid transporter 7-like n=1 Tax=Physella acuta TaxID=109671 RepID=UPI0027DE72CF|nr:sodium-coupled neutral amino acid transporter 7-like [Physella acuta]
MKAQQNSLKFEYIALKHNEGKSLTSFSPPNDKNRGQTGWFAATFLVVNIALGTGLLNFPMAYHQSGGILWAVIIQSFFMVFVVMAIFILAYCSDIKGSNTYQDVVLSLCGPKAQLACAVCVLLYCFGSCVSFLIVIGDQWEIFFFKISQDLYCKSKPFYMTRAFIISATSIVFILPLCFPKRIDFLKYTSVVGVIGILYVAVLVIVKYFLPHDNQGTISTSPRSWVDVFLVAPEICFSYDCHVNIIPIYSCLAKRNIREFSKTVTLAMILCIITYTVTASLGYLQFGDLVTNDILLSFNPTADVMVAVVLVAVKNYTIYPILCFVGKTALDSLWRMFWKMNPEEISHKEKLRRVITTLVWFTLTLLLSIFIPNIGVAIQLLGALSAVFIFVLPGLCLLNAMQNILESGEKQDQRVHVLRAIAMVFLAVGAFIIGVIVCQAIIKDLQGVEPDSSKFTCI